MKRPTPQTRHVSRFECAPEGSWMRAGNRRDPRGTGLRSWVRLGVVGGIRFRSVAAPPLSALLFKVDNLSRCPLRPGPHNARRCGRRRGPGRPDARGTGYGIQGKRYPGFVCSVRFKKCWMGGSTTVPSGPGCGASVCFPFRCARRPGSPGHGVGPAGIVRAVGAGVIPGRRLRWPGRR